MPVTMVLFKNHITENIQGVPKKSVNSQANLPALEQICPTAEVKSPPGLIGPCGHVTGHNNNSNRNTDVICQLQDKLYHLQS